jgi:hypothetical protein
MNITAAEQKRVNTVLNDKRYSIYIAYNGHVKPSYIARFCEDYIASEQQFDHILGHCINHQVNRMNNL